MFQTLFTSKNLVCIAFGIALGAGYGIYSASSRNPRVLFKNIGYIAFVMFFGHIFRETLQRKFPSIFTDDMFFQFNVFAWSVVTSFITLYLLIFRGLRKRQKGGSRSKLIGFFEFVIDGFHSTREIADKSVNITISNGEVVAINQPNPALLIDAPRDALNKEIEINAYIRRLHYSNKQQSNYDAADEYLKEMDEFLKTVCEVDKLFDKGSAIAVMRKFNRRTEKLVAFPHDALKSLRRPNIVDNSYNNNWKIVKYSECNRNTFQKIDEIETGKYDDCLAMCILAQNGIPFLSFELYYKGLAAQKMAQFLIDLNVIKEIKLEVIRKFDRIAPELGSEFADLEFDLQR